MTTGDAKNMVRNGGGGECRNGLRAWSKLTGWYDMMTAQGRRKLLSQILQPTGVKKHKDVQKATESWDKLLNRYVECTSTALPDDVLVVAYMALLPSSMISCINQLATEFTTLGELRTYVRKLQFRNSLLQIQFCKLSFANSLL